MLNLVPWGNGRLTFLKLLLLLFHFTYHKTHLLPPKPRSSFRHLKRSIKDFHINSVLVPEDKAANNVVVVDDCIILIL